MTEAQSREAFEKWQRAEGRGGAYFQGYEGAKGWVYEDSFMQARWTGWQARGTSAEAREKELGERVAGLVSALEPFAKMHDEILGACSLYSGPQADPTNWAKSCEWEDLQRAKEALSASPATPSAVERVVKAVLQQKQAMEIYDRVHAELDAGKAWEEINCGIVGNFSGGKKPPYDYWRGYMQQRFINGTREALSALSGTE